MATSATTAKEYEEITARNLREKLQELRGKHGRPEEIPAAPKVAKKAPSYFTAEPEPATDKVRLSTLIPSWDHALNTLDPFVTVYSRADYTAEQGAMIPVIDPHYRPNQHALAELAHALEYMDSATWLTGLPSVGKSSLVSYFGAIVCRPVYRVNFNGHFSTEDVLGGQSVVSDEHGMRTEWHDGIIPHAMRVPNALMLLDEPTAAPAEIQMALQAALERGGKLTLTNKPGSIAERVVTPADGFRWIMADNTVGTGDVTGMFTGTSPQNSAWLDRVGTFVKVGWLRSNDESEMLRGYFPTLTAHLTDKIVQVAGILRGAMAQGTISTVMSMRVTQAWCAHTVTLRDPAMAFQLAYLNRMADNSEVEAAREIYRNVFGS